MFVPFIINSNIYTRDDEISTYESFMDCCAGNIGNMYITYSLAKELGIDIQNTKQIKNIYTFKFGNLEEQLGDVSDCTHTILVLQDQIRKSLSYGYRINYKGIIELIDYIDRPLLIIGIGANCLMGYDINFYKDLDPELIWFLKELSLRCCEIGIRGEFTESVLKNIGINNTCVIGCPSYFENGSGRLIKKTNIEKLEDILISGSFYDYKDKPKLRCREVLQDKCSEKYIKLIAFDEIGDDIDKDEIEEYVNKRFYIFSDVESWKSKIRSHKFVIGYRLHGTIIALNSGVPAICCNGDSRALEMCDYLKIPRVQDVIWSEDELLNYYEQLNIDDVNSSYNSLFLRYCDFINRNIGMDHKKIDFNIQNAHIEQPKLDLYKGYHVIKGRLSKM